MTAVDYRETRPDFTRGPAADLFSSTVATQAISAATEAGLLDALNSGTAIDLEDWARETDIDAELVASLCAPLEWAGVVSLNDGKLSQGDRFEAAYRTRGYFYWLVRGCGEMFSTAPGMLSRRQRTGDFYHRDMRAVAIGSRLIGDEIVEPLFDQVLAQAKIRSVADLGCGSGQRLVRILGNHPGATAVGIDIAPASVTLAREVARDAGLADRITIAAGDVVDPDPDLRFPDVDTVTCVFLGHDFWPFERCVNGLRKLHDVFPNAERFLLCDVTRSEERPGPDTPIFTLGFELAHALMGVYLPTLKEWHQAFDAAGWEVVREHPTTAPPGGTLFELAPTGRGPSAA